MHGLRAALIAVLCVIFGLLSVACSCGDDDDDDSGSPPDDDVDDYMDDDDTDDDADDDADDDIDDDTDDDTEPLPEANCIVPVDYDGDGDAELLLEVLTTDGVDVYLVEPGTFERELILHLQNLLKQGGPSLDVADFDGNRVWDIVTGILDADHAAIYSVYMNGDFETPAFVSDPIADSIPNPTIIDERGDGFPDILAWCGDCGGDQGFTLLRNEGGTFTQGPDMTVPGADYLQPLLYTEPGDIHPKGADATGASEPRELLAFEEYEDGGAEYVRLHVFDMETGDLVLSSDPIETREGNGWTSARSGDFDGDGLAEVSLSMTYYDSSVPEQYAQFFVYSVDSDAFVEEYASPTFADAYASSENAIDVDRDGVFDPIFGYDGDGWEEFWLVLDGTDDYAERFTHERPDHNQGRFATSATRGGDVGYSIDGTDPEMVFVYEFHDAGAAEGRLTRVSMLDGTESAALNTFPLGESGRSQYYAADFGRDDVMDIVVLGDEQVWGGSEWEHDFTFYLFNGANLDLAFTSNLGAIPFEPQFSTGFDLTGDLVPDPVVIVDNADPVYWLVFPCTSDGCDTPLTIDYGTDESFWFVGPFL